MLSLSEGHDILDAMNRNRIGALLTLTGGMCWGISGCVGQYLFSTKGMSALWLVPIRLSGAGVLLLLYYLIKEPHLLFGMWKTKGNACRMLVYGILGISCSQFTYFLTIQLSTAGTATILQDVSPVIILGIVCFQEHRRPMFLELCAVVFAFTGVFLLTTHGNVRNMAVRPAAIVTGLVCAVCVVVYTMTPGQLQKQFPTPLLQGWAFLLGGIFFMILFHPWTYHYVPDATALAGIATVILVGNVIAFNLYMTGVTFIGPERASLFSFAEPVTAAIIGTLLLGSPFTIWDATGFLCIFLMLVGLFFSNSSSKRTRLSGNPRTP